MQLPFFRADRPQPQPHTGLGVDLDTMLSTSPQWAEIQKQMEAEGAPPFNIESAKALFISSFKEMNTQHGIDPSVAIETAKRFVGSDRTLQGALQGVEGLLSVGKGGAPPAEVVQEFTTVIIGAAVAAGAIVPGVGAMIAIGVAVTLEILKSVGLFGNQDPGTTICGYTFSPPPNWTVGCVGMYGERVPGPKNLGWRKFPDPSNGADAEWFKHEHVSGGQWGAPDVYGDLIFGSQQKIGAAFPAYHRLQCDLAITSFPVPVQDFYRAFYTAWKANAEYALNGLKASADWEVLLHVITIWNRTHDATSAFTFEMRDNDINPFDDMNCKSAVPYVAILVKDIRKYSGQPDIDAPNNAIKINTGARKGAPRLIGRLHGVIGGSATKTTSTSGSTALKVIVAAPIVTAAGLGIYAFATKQSFLAVSKMAWRKTGGVVYDKSKQLIKKARR